MTNFLSARHLRELQQSDEGQAIVLVAFSLLILLLMAGMGVDVGYLHYQKQQMQKAADSGAIAAATAIGYRGDYVQAALSDTAANGFTNGMKGVSVMVNNPPGTPGDPFEGNPHYVEVVISQPRPTFFMNVGGFASVNVRSRAVASAYSSASGCIYAMDPSDPGTLKVDNNVTLTTNCAIYVNSNSPAALMKVGHGEVIAAGTGSGIGVVGGYIGSGFTPEPKKGIPLFTDPLGTLPPPPSGGSCTFNNLIVSGGTLGPAVYCGLTINQGPIPLRLMPGPYILRGGLTVHGYPRIFGNGVTFYNSADASHPYQPITLQASPDSSLKAPTGGPLAGVLVFQDRSVVDPLAWSFFDNSNGATFTGALYFPTTPVRVKGLPILGSYTPLVAWQIEVAGTGLIKNNFLPPDQGSPIPGAALVE